LVCIFHMLQAYRQGKPGKDRGLCRFRQTRIRHGKSGRAWSAAPHLLPQSWRRFFPSGRRSWYHERTRDGSMPVVRLHASRVNVA
jgi:hypothetical protein